MATDTDLAKLSVQLELQTAAFEAGVKQMDRQLKKMDANTKRSAKGMNTLNKSVKLLKKNFIALAGAVTVGALASQTKQAIEFGDSIAKTADKVGVTTNELQELRFAASQSGIETRTLDMALQRFARRMGEAAQGTGELLKTTQELGIKFQDSEGRYFSTTELLGQYAEAMGKAETQQEKLRLAFKAFDSEGAALVNLLGEGSEELQAFREQAVELGLVLGEDLVRESEILNDKFDILATQVKVRVTEAFLTATQAVLQFFGVFADASEAQKELDKVQARMKEIEDIVDAGNLGQIGFDILQDEYTDLKNKRANLIAIIEDLDATTQRLTENNKANADSTDRQANATTRLAERLKAQLDPLIGLKKQIEEIQSTVGNGLTQSEAWILITRAIEEYTAALEKAGEAADVALTPQDKFNAKVDELLGTLNSEANEAAEYLGVLYAALERLTDPALRAKVEEMIENFTFGEDDLDPDPIKESFDDLIKGINASLTKAETALPDDWLADIGVGFGSVKEEADEALDEILQAVNGFSRDFTNTLVDGLKTGEFAFDDFAKNVLETIAKMLLNDIFTQFFEIIYGGIKSYFNIGTTSTGSGDTRLGTLGRVAMPTDGMTRAGETSTAMVGTVVARASPKGTSSTGQVTVNVNNYGNDDVSVTERQDSNGGIDIDVLIKQKVNSGFARGDYDKMLGSSFGLRRLGY